MCGPWGVQGVCRGAQAIGGSLAPPCGGRGWPTGRVRGLTVQPMTDVRETNPGWRGGGPLCSLRWVFVGRQPRGWADTRPGSARPHRRECVRIAPCSGNPLGVRAVCQPEEPRGPFALTPTLSRGHLGSVDRRSCCGRGGQRGGAAARRQSAGPSPPLRGERVADRPGEGGKPHGQ